jgi:hypothetical protein
MMNREHHNLMSCPALILCGCAILAALPASPAQDIPASAPATQSAAEGALWERQRAVRDRVQRLESSMLNLSRLLAESEPEKAERLRDALEYVGSHRIKARLQSLTEMLESRRFSEAERQQVELLADMDNLLKLLTSSMNELERRREERRRLEELKQAVRALLDEQMQLFQQTRGAGERAEGAEAAGTQPAEGAAAELAEALRRLEQLQRELQKRADDKRRELQKPPEAERLPGTPKIEQAAGRMQKAADELGENNAESAREQQQAALENLQEALDDLEETLRQVRREESEETLAALEARLRGMLERELRVRETVTRLSAQETAAWTRVERLQLSEAVDAQRQTAEECQTALRLVVDEGTTVIVPELLRQVGGDMSDVLGRLETQDVSAGTQRVLGDVIAVLEEMLDAVERKREEDARLEKEGGQSQRGGSNPLLPGSAELKLLKNSQLRLNERTLKLAGDGSSEAAAAEPALERLSERQRRLADLTRRMNERQ